MLNFKHINKNHSHTIVFVNGFSQNLGLFTKQIRFFRKFYNCLAIDLRGHGKSKNQGPFGIEEYADDVEDLLINLKIKNIIYWGTHTGTAIALLLYFRANLSFKGFIFEGVVIPGFISEEINKNIDRAKAVSQNQNIKLAKQDWFKNSEWFDYINHHPIRARKHQHKKIINDFSGIPWTNKENPRIPTNLLNRISEIKLPILAYNGEYDMHDFLEMAKILQTNTHVQYQRIPDSGGFPLWENYREVNKTVFNFLNENTGGANA